MIYINKPVTIAQITSGWETKILPDVFAVNYGKPHIWLQRLCGKVLAWLGCHVTHEDTVYQVERIEYETLEGAMNALQKQYHAMQLVYGEGGHLLMGPDFHKDLLNAPVSWHGSLQALDYQFQFYYDRNALKVFGMRVTVLPWMEGVVIVPKRYWNGA